MKEKYTEDWRARRVWLRALEEAVPAGIETPAQMALSEARIFNRRIGQNNDPGSGSMQNNDPGSRSMQNKGQSNGRKKDQGSSQYIDQSRSRNCHKLPPHVIQVLPEENGTFPEEGYALCRREDAIEVRGGRTGILYGTYAAMEAILCGAHQIPDGVQTPHFPLRMLDSWDNMDGSIERGYAGRSIWFEGGRFSYDPARIRQLGRMLASTGINVLCINNVNVHAPAQSLGDGLLDETAAFASVLRPFGIRLMLSIDFSLPLQRGMDTADPLSEDAVAWWKQYAGRLWDAIPDLAGFLVKADSEHRPGPNAYGRDHAQGANMLARAIAPHGGFLVWRAFVYNCEQDWRDTSTDRPCAAWKTYHPLDGAFDENVILQVKYGPFDFQVREPLSPLFYGMKNTSLSVELQLAQEYTGQQIDLFAMPPMWREIFDQIQESVSFGGMRAAAAVSNLGRDDNWTGHPFAALNLYAFGRYAWDPCSDPERVTRRWVHLTYGTLQGGGFEPLPEQETASLPGQEFRPEAQSDAGDVISPEQEDALTRILLESRSIYEQYTGTLGLCWMVRPQTHYGPSPYGYEFDVWGTYNRADRDAVGVDRAKDGLAQQYPPELEQLYSDKERCPEELLLFFHRLPYTFVMRDGRTLIQRIYDDHFEGCERAGRIRKLLAGLNLFRADAGEVQERMKMQERNAREWRDVVNTFFYRFSGIPDERGRKIYP